LDEHDPAVAIAIECSKLERELNEANKRIKQLEEWYEHTVLNCYCRGSEVDATRDALRKDQRRKAKEAKP
jgi:hypothetical protein